MPASGIETTLRTLLRSTNPAATDQLVVALGSSDPSLRVGAVRALAMRESSDGHRKLVEGYAKLPPDAQAALLDVPTRAPLLGSLIEMINPRTPRLAKRAVEVAIAWGTVAVLPATVEALGWPDNGLHAPLFADAVLKMSRQLEEAVREYDPTVKKTAESERPEDPAFARRAAVNALAAALDNYEEHSRHEVLEAMLLLTPSDEPALLRAFRDPTHAAHEPLLLALRTSSSNGAIGVLAGALGDSRAPQALLNVVAERCDAHGLGSLFERVGYPVGTRYRDNVRRIEGFAWLQKDGVGVLSQLSGPAQATAITLAAASESSRRRLAEAVSLLLESEHAEGRLASARAIDSLPAHLATEPLQAAVVSEDAAVVTVGARMLRRKEYPGAAAVLVALLDHPDKRVRSAAQSGLGELTFSLFRDQVDQIPAESRRRVGQLVAKADPMAVASLRGELASGAAERRMRSLELIELMGLTIDLVEVLIVRLQTDNDTGVRAEIARLLGRSSALPSILEALEEGQADPSPAVRKASGEGLLAISEISLAGVEAN